MPSIKKGQLTLKRTRYSIIYSVVMMMFSVITLSVSSYAWFVVNSQTSAQGTGFSVGYEAGTGTAIDAFKYDIDRKQAIRLDNIGTTGILMNDYDTIFKSNNQYCPALVRVTVTGSPFENGDEVNLSLRRTAHGDQQLETLSDYLSSATSFKCASLPSSLIGDSMNADEVYTKGCDYFRNNVSTSKSFVSAEEIETEEYVRGNSETNKGVETLVSTSQTLSSIGNLTVSSGKDKNSITPTVSEEVITSQTPEVDYGEHDKSYAKTCAYTKTYAGPFHCKLLLADGTGTNPNTKTYLKSNSNFTALEASSTCDDDYTTWVVTGSNSTYYISPYLSRSRYIQSGATTIGTTKSGLTLNGNRIRSGTRSSNYKYLNYTNGIINCSSSTTNAYIRLQSITSIVDSYTRTDTVIVHYNAVYDYKYVYTKQDSLSFSVISDGSSTFHIYFYIEYDNDLMDAYIEQKIGSQKDIALDNSYTLQSDITEVIIHDKV